MIFEAIEYLVSLGKSSSEPIQVSRNNKYCIYYFPNDGSLKEVPEAPPGVRVTAATISDFVDLAIRESQKLESPGRVYISDQMLSLVIDGDEYRQCQLLCRLTRTKEFEVLTKGITDSHRSVLKWLRKLPYNEAVFEVSERLKTIQLQKSQSVSSEVARGRDTLGSQIARQVLGIDAIPESFDVECPVFSEYAATQTIVLGVDVDTDSCEITIEPLGNSAEDAVRSSMRLIQSFITERLQGTELDAYCGYCEFK